MATTKSAPKAPKALVEKSKGSGKAGYFSIQILVEEIPYNTYGGRTRTTSTNKKPSTMEYLEDHFSESRYDGIGEWAIKCIAIDEETFKTGYEQL